MVRQSQEKTSGYLPSVLDRLIDASLGHETSDLYTEREYIASVQRDIEDLLNARQTLDDIGEHPEIQESIIGFGLPDSSKFELHSPHGRRLFSRVLEAVIRIQEPRVRQVRITLLDQENLEGAKQVHFQIDVALHLKDSPNLSFESTMRLGSGHFELNHGPQETR